MLEQDCRNDAGGQLEIDGNFGHGLRGKGSYLLHAGESHGPTISISSRGEILVGWCWLVEGQAVLGEPLLDLGELLGLSLAGFGVGIASLLGEGSGAVTLFRLWP